MDDGPVQTIADQQVELTSIGSRLSVDDIYDDPRALTS